MQTHLIVEWLLLQQDRCHSVPAVLKRKHCFRGKKEEQEKAEQIEAEFGFDLKFKEISRNYTNTRHFETPSNLPPSYWVLSCPSVTLSFEKRYSCCTYKPLPEHTGGFGSLDKKSSYFKALLHCRDYNPEAMGRATGVTVMKSRSSKMVQSWHVPLLLQVSILLFFQTSLLGISRLALAL